MEIFNKIYPADFRKDLRDRASKRGADPATQTADRLLNGTHPNLQAWRIHLAAWLEFCESHGGLDADRRSRLMRVRDWCVWNQVLNELRIPYFLARVYGMHIDYVGPIQNTRTAEVRVTKGETAIIIEVKTPGREPPISPSIAGCFDDTPSIKQALRAANKQFSHNEHNVLAIGTHLLEFPDPRFNDMSVTEAIYGHEVITCTIEKGTGKPVDEPHVGFRPDGKLQRNRFTRIGAVLVFYDEHSDKRGRASRMYHCAIYHNPYAEIPIPYDIFWGTRQLFLDEQWRSYWKWPDGTTYTFSGD